MILFHNVIQILALPPFYILKILLVKCPNTSLFAPLLSIFITLGLHKSMLKKLFDKNDFMRLDEIERIQKEIEKVKNVLQTFRMTLWIGKFHQKTSIP